MQDKYPKYLCIKLRSYNCVKGAEIIFQKNLKYQIY